jgi:hypothetical protein
MVLESSGLVGVVMFDDSYFFLNEEEIIPLPEKISVSTALEVVKIVTMETNYKLVSIAPDCEGGVLLVFSDTLVIQISSRGVLFPSKNNCACRKYFTLEEFGSSVEVILSELFVVSAF